MSDPCFPKRLIKLEVPSAPKSHFAIVNATKGGRYYTITHPWIQIAERDRDAIVDLLARALLKDMREHPDAP